MTKTRIEHWCGEIPKFAKALRTWGEAGVVKVVTVRTKKKLGERGATCMMVGYCLQHDTGVYRMWDPNTNRIHVTRDIIWLQRMFFTETLSDEEIKTLNTEDRERISMGSSGVQHFEDKK